MSRGGFHNPALDVGDNDDDDDCQVVTTRDMLRPSAATTSMTRDPTAARDTARAAADGDEHNEKMEKKRQQIARMKQRAKSAAVRTKKAAGSSWTCGACVVISGLVTFICGIVLIAVGQQESNDFVIIGVVFFIFGLTMAVIAAVYTVIHYYRKRKKEKADPFKIKAAEREREERDRAEAEGRVKPPAPVSSVLTPRNVPIVCAPEHEHENVTQHRLAEARRSSLFQASATSDTAAARPPMKKSMSAFQLPPIKPEGGHSNSVSAFSSGGGGGPLPPISSKLSSNLVGMDGGKSRGMSKSKSAAQFHTRDTVEEFSMDEHSGARGPLPPLHTRGAMHTIADLSDGENDI